MKESSSGNPVKLRADARGGRRRVGFHVGPGGLSPSSPPGQKRLTFPRLGFLTRKMMIVSLRLARLL